MCTSYNCYVRVIIIESFYICYMMTGGFVGVYTHRKPGKKFYCRGFGC